MSQIAGAVTNVDQGDEVAITPDGSTVIVSYVAEDGARGAPNLTVFAIDRKGIVTKTIAVVDAEQGVVAGGEAARAKLLADSKAIQLARLESVDAEHDDDRHRVFADLTVDLSESGTLSMRPKGHAAVTRRKSAWRTKPSATRLAAMKREDDAGRVGCFNPARIGAVWLDTKRRAAVVFISYRGTDACWEPSSDFTVVTW